MDTSGNFITIKEPCHVGWENMRISEKGRFCSSCKKHIHDFTNSSIDEIQKMYADNKGEVCGHIPSAILHDQYVLSQMNKEYFRLLKLFCIAVLFCFGNTLFAMNSSTTGTLKSWKKSFLYNFPDTKDSIAIIFFVTDKENGEALPFVSVLAYSNDALVCNAITDINGKCELKLVKNKFQKIDIETFYIGYKNEMIKDIVLDEDKKMKVAVEMSQTVMTVGALVTYPIKKHRKPIFRKK